MAWERSGSCGSICWVSEADLPVSVQWATGRALRALPVGCVGGFQAVALCQPGVICAPSRVSLPEGVLKTARSNLLVEG